MKTGNPAAFSAVQKMAAVLLCVILAASILIPVAGYAQKEVKVIRVGWYESPYNIKDNTGRRSGYAYDYQQKIAAYTGWHYQYVESSWPKLMKKLENGEIDMLSDVSYTEERAEQVLFSDLPMGSEDYYLFVLPDYTGIRQDDLTTINGKRIGIDQGSVEVDQFRDWAAQHGILPVIVELAGGEAEALERLEQGELDGYVNVDAYESDGAVVPICKTGSSDYYFAVRKDRPDLLEELNAAMTRIRDGDRYYNQRLFEKYVSAAGANRYLSASEQEWLEGHGPIRIGYHEDYLAFCGTDPGTGELTGALKDYLISASGCFSNAHPDFEPVAYPNTAAMVTALKNREVDCVFPVNFSDYEGEVLGMVLTPPLMSTDVYAVVRSTEQKEFGRKETVTAAVDRGNLNYDMFLKKNYPEWQIETFENAKSCLMAISGKEADCFLVSNYRYNNISKSCEILHLSPVPIDLKLDYCILVNNGDIDLYTILCKTIDLVPTSSVHASLTYYSTEDAKMSLADFIRENLFKLLLLGALVAGVVLFLVIRSFRAQKKAIEVQRLIAATENDFLTGLFNREYFLEYANQMYEEFPDKPMDLIVMNIDHFHSVNVVKGRDFGDLVLRALGDEIKAFLREKDGIGGRGEGDMFGIYCEHLEDYRELFERFQRKLNTLARDTNIRLRMGVMPWQRDLGPVLQLERAHTACNLAKRSILGKLVVFDEKLQEREARDRRLLNDLRRAIENREFEVHYQPKFNIQTEPPKLESAEALIRWRHPELGMISPMEFIPLFEQNGQVGEVDRYVWTETARQIAAWRKKYGVVLPVSVNLSRVDLLDPALESILDQLMEQNGLDHSALDLEVTESAYTENAEQVIRVIEGLRKKGYLIEMDDFGSGYSSLNMLSTMPIDVLKMDQAFIQNIEHDENEVQFVELILGIARTLDVPVVAEGVETESQCQKLKEMGCKLVQGYYFSRPLPAVEFETAILRKTMSAEINT